MLKKTLLATATAAALIGPAAAFAADFGQGTITFTGSVLDAPCSIPAADLNQTIDLGQISKNDLTTTNSTSATLPIEIHLTGCNFTTTGTPAVPQLNKLRISFAGTFSDATKAILTNTAPNGATNVGIQIVDNAGKVITSTPTAEQTLAAGNLNTLRYGVRLINTGTTAATAGKVGAQVVFTLTYS